MKKEAPTIELVESPNLQQKLAAAFLEDESEDLRDAATDRLVIEKLRMMRPTIDEVVVKTAPGKVDSLGYRILYVNGK